MYTHLIPRPSAEKPLAAVAPYDACPLFIDT